MRRLNWNEEEDPSIAICFALPYTIDEHFVYKRIGIYTNLPYAAESDEANMKQLGSSVHVSRSDNVDDMGS